MVFHYQSIETTRVLFQKLLPYIHVNPTQRIPIASRVNEPDLLNGLTREYYMNMGEA